MFSHMLERTQMPSMSGTIMLYVSSITRILTGSKSYIAAGMSFLYIHYRPRSEGDNALGSIHLSVCLSVLSRLKCMTYDLDFWDGADLDLGWDVIVGQQRAITINIGYGRVITSPRCLSVFL